MLLEIMHIQNWFIFVHYITLFRMVACYCVSFIYFLFQFLLTTFSFFRSLLRFNSNIGLVFFLNHDKMMQFSLLGVARLANPPTLSTRIHYVCHSTTHKAPCLCPGKAIENCPKPGEPALVWETRRSTWLLPSDQPSSGYCGHQGSKSARNFFPLYLLCKSAFLI